MKLGSFAITVFAIACILGGLTGYIRAESVPSLITGAGGGLVLLICSRTIKKSGSQKAAFVALMLSLAITTKFAIAFFSTFTVVPALIMLVLGTFSSLSAFKYARTKRASA